ncbi:MAG: hypothetical protein AB8B65_15130 [Kordia sp.]|uniref:hypothetical protein n=1 Tax=Kordia sp. TaxID=1965332 RepID=UPI00385CE864
MKKQKKLNLGKINIANVNIVNELIGGVTTQCNTEGGNVPFEESCVCTQVLTKCCAISIPDTICATTQHTKAESNYCGGGDPSQNGEIC